MGGPLAPSVRIFALLVTLVYAEAAVTLGSGERAQLGRLILRYAQTFAGVWLFVGLVLLAWRMFSERRRGGERRSWQIAGDFLAERWAFDRCVSIGTPFVALVLLLSSYTFIKQFLLPSVGFTMGPVIAAKEHALLGIDPWEATHALLTSPWATKALDLAYHAWFLPMVLGVALCSFAPPGSRLAARYLLCYVLLWPVQGSLVAYFFPAAGPCFFHVFQVDKHRFDGLMTLLQAQDLWLRQHGVGGLAALEFQEKLLDFFGSGEGIPGAGISAMPSLHNAMATLFACAGFKLSRRLGVALSAYAGVILLASVHLGWHYLTDGVAAIVLTVFTWWVTGQVMALCAKSTQSSERGSLLVTAPAA